MKKLIATFVIVALLLSLAPSVVYAAAGGTTAEAKGGNTTPTVDAVALIEAGSETTVSAMAPLSEYRVKTTLGDINTIDDIAKVEFHVYHTTDGSSWDADDVAIYTWTKSGDVWAVDNGGAATTWEIVSGNCTTPSVFTGTTGDWYLAFKPGKLAQYDATANWHASVEVWDEHPSQTGTGPGGNASMGAYAEISLDYATIVFGDATAGIQPGDTGYIDTPATHKLTSSITSNKIYDLSSRSAATWDDGGSNTITLSGTVTQPPATSGQFSLTIDDQELGLPGEPKTNQAVTGSDTTITGHGADARVTTTAGADEGTTDTELFMALSLALNGINEVIYSGTITFTITN